MEDYRIILINPEGDDSCSLDVLGSSLERCKSTAEMYLAMNQGRYKKAIIMSKWKQMWRQAIPAIDFTLNL